MTDAYPPRDADRFAPGVVDDDEAVFDTTTVPAAGGTATPPPIPTPPQSPTPPSGGDYASGVKDTAKEEAANVGSSAKDAGRRVADAAKEEAGNVASEAKHQARQLFSTVMREAGEQASTQQHRAAEGMRTIASDLSSMASGGGAGDGIAAQLVGEVGSRIDAAASWAAEREPADLLDELKRYARRHPVTFIAVAGVAGLLVGRLTRGLIADAKDGATKGGAGRTPAADSYRVAAPSRPVVGGTGATGAWADGPMTGTGASDAWADEPVTGTAASDAIYGTRPTEERGL